MGCQVGNGERGVFFFEIGTVGGVFRYASLERGNGVDAKKLRAVPAFSTLMIQREYPREAFYTIVRLVGLC